MVWLHGVRDADARLGLSCDGETVVEVSAYADVEEPVPCLDLVLSVEGQLLYIGAADEVEVASAAGQVIWQKDRVEAAANGRIV